MHQRCVEADEAGRVGGGVDRVVVTRHHGEGGHVARRGDRRAADEAARGVVDRGLDATELGCRRCGIGGGDAAADGEAFDHRGDHVTVVAQDEVHGDDAARGGFVEGAGAGLDVDVPVGAVAQFGERDPEVHAVVEVHGVEQALDDGVAVGEFSGAEGGVDRGPAGPDEGVGGAGRGAYPGECGAGDRGVRGEQVGGQGEGVADDAERRALILVDAGQVGDVVTGRRGGPDARYAGEQRVDAVGEVFPGDDRHGAGGAGLPQQDGDVDVLDDEGVVALESVPVGVAEDPDRPRVAVRVGFEEFERLGVEDVGGIVDEVTVPHDVRGGQQEVPFGDGGGQAGEHLVDRGVVFPQVLDAGGLEAAEEFSDGFIDAVDARDGDRSGDAADLVGVVALVVCLPECVQSPPAGDVGVDGRHPGHGLVVLAVQPDEPGGVPGADDGVGGLRVAVDQLLDGCGAVGDGVDVREQGGDLAVVGGREARLDSVDEVEEAVGPARVGPGPGEFDEALQPLRVGHLGDLTEVGLRGGVEGRDDLVAARGDGLVGGGVQGAEQSGAAGRGVVHLVHVGVQVGEPGGDPATGVAASDPAAGVIRVDAGCVDEELLDLR